MPIYEYACETCHRSFEELQKVGDGARPSCPSCGKRNRVRRLMSRSSFQLKGGGWYATDYKATPQKKDPGGEAAA